MIAAVTPLPERDRIPEIADLFRRFIRLGDLSASRTEELRLDIDENDKEFRVRAEIPGARKEDLQVRIEGRTLTIGAQFEDAKSGATSRDGHRMLVSEMRHGSLSRTVQLPHEVEEKKVHAKFENGVLSLTCPKRASGKQTLVAIQ